MSDEILKNSTDRELLEQELEVVAGGTEGQGRFAEKQNNSSPDGSSTALVLKSMNMVAFAFQFIALDLNDTSTTRGSET